MLSLTAAEFAGTTFPSLLITQPAGNPGADVCTVVVVARVVEEIHGQPVLVRVDWSLPMPAGIEGEADVTFGISPVATGLPASCELPITAPPTATIEPAFPELSPYLYCVPVE